MFPTLDDAQIERMRAVGHERAVHAGEILFEQGEASTKFFVVIEGSIEVVHPDTAGEHQITVHEPGGFTGEINMLAGTRSLVRGRHRARPQRFGARPRRGDRHGRALPQAGARIAGAVRRRGHLLQRDGGRGTHVRQRRGHHRRRGNSAGQAAVFLAHTARNVFILVRGKGLSETMSRYLVRRIEDTPAIQLLTETEIVALDGGTRSHGSRGSTSAPASASRARSVTCS